MKILALDRILEGATEARIKQLLRDEMLHAWPLYLKGVIREWYFRQDRPGVVLVLEADSLDAANTLLAELPLVKERLVAFDMIPLGPFLPLQTLWAPAQPRHS